MSSINRNENLLRTRRVCPTPMKRRYATKAVALMFAARAERNGRERPAITAYKCRGCRSWHLTSH